MKNVMRKKKSEKINEKIECDEYVLSLTFDLFISNVKKHQNSNKRMKLKNHVFFSSNFATNYVKFRHKKNKTYQKHFKQYEKSKKNISRKKIFRFNYINLKFFLSQFTT